MSKHYRGAGTVAVCLALAACTNATREPAAQGMTAELAAEIESACGLPAGALSGKAAVSDVRPKIACAVEEGRKRGVAVGFVSNPVDPDS